MHRPRNTVMVLSMVVWVGMIVMVPRLALAVWPSDPTVNVPIITEPSSQTSPKMIGDGAGGAIITWMDLRNGNYDIYTQRVNASGVVQWTVGGVAICTAPYDQRDPQLIGDGAGGAIITWQDYRDAPGSPYGSPDIYAQRVNASGVVQWTAGGVAISTAGNYKWNPQLTGDGAGGAIITWWDGLSGSYDIYAQRVDASGVVQWPTGYTPGVAICTAPGDQYEPQVTGDGAGGAIITWWDGRSGSLYKIYAQRVDHDGYIHAGWPANGSAISTDGNDQRYPQLTGDGLGGAIITWENYIGLNADIYAQRVDHDGYIHAGWPASGVAISTATNNQVHPQLIGDGAGGAIITWQDGRSNGSDIYAQRVDASGAVQWTPDGLAICTEATTKYAPQLTGDGAGGAIITWMDYRGATNYDIYAQRVDALGAVQGPAEGIAISTAPNSQTYPQLIGDGAGGAIITWMDYRSGTNYDLYAQLDSALPMGTVATPTFSPGGGIYSAPQTVTIRCATPGATIHYTTNGLTPTESDPTILSGGTVAVNGSLTLKAVAFKPRWTSSSVMSAVYSIIPPPAAPSALGAAASSSSQINLTWTDNSNEETGFRIERCTGGGCTNFAQIATVAANAVSFNDTGLAAITTYTYRVCAYNAGGSSGYSNTAAATTQAPPVPAPPSALTATAVSALQINLTWTDNSTNEDGIQIERCSGAGCTNFAQIASLGANVTTYGNTGLTANTTYTYRVRAYNADGNSAYSNTATATTPVLPPPAAPSNLTATAASTSQINLAWTDNSSDETGFKIERCTGSGCTDFAQIASVGANVTTYGNTGLTTNTTYTYRVRAYSSWGDSVYSNSASAMTLVLPPQSIHVGDLDASSESNDNAWLARVTITVHTGTHAPLSQVKITGVWSNGATGSASCTTNTSGKCTVTKSNLSSAISAVTLTVTDLTRTGWTYTAYENHDPDGDSSGTSIVVSRPDDGPNE